MVTLSTLLADATRIFAAYEGVEPELASLCLSSVEGTCETRCGRLAAKFEDCGEKFLVSLDFFDSGQGAGFYGMMKASNRPAAYLGPFPSCGSLVEAAVERAASYAAEPLHVDEAL